MASGQVGESRWVDTRTVEGKVKSRGAFDPVGDFLEELDAADGEDEIRETVQRYFDERYGDGEEAGREQGEEDAYERLDEWHTCNVEAEDYWTTYDIERGAISPEFVLRVVA